VPTVAETPWGEYRGVTPGYFAAIGVPVLRGRDLGPQDRPDTAPVVLVNRVLAERYFLDEEPLGRQLDFGDQQPTIVGVVGDVRQATLDEDPRPEIYVPYA
jgi:putative ABC transport system permease protein